MPLAGLSHSVKTGAAIAINKSAKARPLTATAADKVAQYMTRWLHRRAVVSDVEFAPEPLPSYQYSGHNTRVVKAEVSGSANSPDYKFDLYSSGGIGNTGGRRWSQNDYLNRGIGVTRFSGVNDFSSYKFFTIGMDTEDGKIQYDKVTLALGLGDGWDSSLLKAEVNSKVKGEKDAMLHAEVWTTYPGDQTDYLVGGVWLLLPNDIATWESDREMGDNGYHSGAFAYGNVKHGDARWGDMPYQVTGKAKYTGNALGLHTSLVEGNLQVQRLVGKVNLMADFGDDTATSSSNHHTRAQIEGTINSLTLDGEKVRGEITLPQGSSFNSSDIRPLTTSNGRSAATTHGLGNIKGINYQGSWGGVFTGNAETNDQPTGIAGTVGGTEVGGTNSFILSFGAKKEKAE